MNYFDDENEIIEWLQDVGCSAVYFPIENEELIKVFESIHSEDQWRLWKNSSGKSDPPPDFYCEAMRLMMDVMRVDDHAFKNKKGKIVNPTNARESKIQKEILESGILKELPYVNKVFVNAITDLPTEQDHNYKFYQTNFVRTVEEHKRKIGLYKQNHPNFKIVFLIFDESSAYMMNLDNTSSTNEVKRGYCHFWFEDRSFLKAVYDSEIDYVIWYTPFKLARLAEGGIVDLPKVVVFKANEQVGTIDYDIEKMSSVEK